MKLKTEKCVCTLVKRNWRMEMEKKKKEKLADSAEITKQSIEQKMNAYNKAKKGPSYVRTRTSYTWHTIVYVQLKTKPYNVWMCVVRAATYSLPSQHSASCFFLPLLFFFLPFRREEGRDTNEMYCFPIFRESFSKKSVFSLAQQMSPLCAASLKITIDNTTAKRFWPASLSPSLQIRVKIQRNELEKEK